METNKAMQTVSNKEIVNEVTEIIKFMGQNSLAELELETEAFSMKLKKHGQIMHQAVFEPSNSVSYSKPVSDSLVSMQTSSNTTDKQINENNYKKVIAPMSGTFYSSPSPSAPPFVKEGDVVSIGQTICIIEAMKMMNEIQSDKAGKVLEIIGNNGQSIEKGTVLILVE